MQVKRQSDAVTTTDMVDIPIRDIAHTSEELNSRARYDPASLSELVESIREHGIIEPIVVRPLHVDSTASGIYVGHARSSPSYMIVAGACRS